MRGGFLLPVQPKRRMWAGARLTFQAPLRVSDPLDRRSEIIKVVKKTGASGPMVFKTLAHQINGPLGLKVIEKQDIVYVATPTRFAPPPPPVHAT